MPELSRFLGIVVAMYYKDHAPPHFHALYGEYEVTVDIASGQVRGDMPRRALSLVLEWRALHVPELTLAWQRAAAHNPLPAIPPLE